MVNSVLIVQPGFLGDAVLATGLVRALAAASPDISVGFLVRKEFGELFAGHPGINTLHSINKREKGELARLAIELKSCEYRAAIVPHRALRSSLIPFKAGIRQRIGFRQSDFRLLLTETVEYDITEREIDRNASLLAPLFVNPSPAERQGWLEPSSDVRNKMRALGLGPGPLVIVAPGSVWETKRWPAENFAALASGLQRAGMHVLLVGSKKEKDLCCSVARNAGIPESQVLAGTLSLMELTGLLAVADHVITNDSAPLHIAESVGTPVIALFGPTVPEFGFAPYLPTSVALERKGLACRPCGIHGHRSCPIETHECMEGIVVEDVLAAVSQGEPNSL